VPGQAVQVQGQLNRFRFLSSGGQEVQPPPGLSWRRGRGRLSSESLSEEPVQMQQRQMHSECMGLRRGQRLWRQHRLD
jgi:hypothetical protein